MMGAVPIPRRTAGVALASFVLLGLPSGALGVAWPDIRASFGLPLAALGGLLLPPTVAYLLSGTASGHLIGRFGLKFVLVGAVGCFVGGLSLMALSPVWWFLLIGNTVVGLGGGALDAAMNSFVATNLARRLLGVLHAAFSVGGALGPLLVVSAVAVGLTWRGAYGILTGVALALAVAVGLVGGWRLPSPPDPRQGSEASDLPSSPSRLPTRAIWPVMLLSLGAFFFYTGTEISAGQWAYTFLTGGRGINVPLAAAAVSGFWWGMALVRAASGFISVRMGASRLIDASLGLALVAAAALWLVPDDTVRFAAMVLFGGALGPLFPTLISLAPSLFGERAVEVVGYQIAAAAVGGNVIVALTGLALQQWGLFLLPAALFAGVAATLLFHHASHWLARGRAGERVGRGAEPVSGGD
jgi:fucose permease